MKEILFYLSKFEFGFYLLICSFIFVLFSFIIKPKTIKLFLLSLFGITIALFLFEISFATYMTHILSRGNKELNTQNELITNNEMSTNTKQVYMHETANRNVRKTYVTIYPNFFRYTKSNSNSQDGFIFLGCSFTYGSALGDEDTLPYYFSKLYNFDKFVLNCSMGGRGTNFAFNVMKSDIIRTFNSNVKVKYFIYSAISYHIDRNFNVSTLNFSDDNFILKDGKFIRAKEPLGFLKVFLKKSYIFHRFFIDFINKGNKEFHKQYFVDKIISMDKLAKEKYGAELIVILWPDIEQPIIEKLKNENINIIELDKKFENEEYKIKNDGHPNAKANKEIAQILFDYINSKS